MGKYSKSSTYHLLKSFFYPSGPGGTSTDKSCVLLIILCWSACFSVLLQYSSRCLLFTWTNNFFLFVSGFWDRVLFCSLGWPWTQNSPASQPPTTKCWDYSLYHHAQQTRTSDSPSSLGKRGGWDVSSLLGCAQLIKYPRWGRGWELGKLCPAI
jgi:hypothetical protein